MESRSGRLRGSNKKRQRATSVFFCPPFLQGLTGASLTLFVAGLVQCPAAIVLEKVLLHIFLLDGRTCVRVISALCLPELGDEILL